MKSLSYKLDQLLADLPDIVRQAEALERQTVDLKQMLAERDAIIEAHEQTIDDLRLEVTDLKEALREARR